MTQLPFIPNQIYIRRSDIHDTYGGNRQSGISPSVTFPYIFIFTGSSGQQHGYEDGWDSPNVFSYTGEGQQGDMKFTNGNLALLKHSERGKRVFLFENHSKGRVLFVNEVEVIEAEFFPTHDRNGDLRKGIKFFFKKVGVSLPYQPDSVQTQLQFADPLSTLDIITDERRFVNTRVGQGAYRKRIIHRWEYKCAVTGFDKLPILIASHILSWSIADDNERLDVHNGILLSPTFDSLFDRKLITFENDGKIILSNQIEERAFNKIGVSGKEKITNFSDSNFTYLEKHRLGFVG